MPLPSEQRGPIRHACWSVSGQLPGGVAGRLRHQAVYGKTFGMKVAMQHTIMVCRIPESVGYLPMLSVRAEGLEPALFYWAGDKRPREDVGGFESVELDRRYIVEVAKGQDHAWLRQLFPPSFIDWLASNTPVDFGFRLDGGVFTCECPQYRGQHRADGEVDDEHLDLLAGAGRQGGEQDPRRGPGGGGRLLGRDRTPTAPPPMRRGREAESTGGCSGMVMKLAGDGTDDSVKEFGDRHGMEVKDAAEFHANHIRLPLPGTASDVLTGTLPGTGTPGDLAWLEFSSAVDLQRNYSAVVIETDRELPSVWVDADDVTIPGFGDELAPAALEAARAHGYGISTAGTQGVRLPGLATRDRRAGRRASASRSCAAGRSRSSAPSERPRRRTSGQSPFSLPQPG